MRALLATQGLSTEYTRLFSVNLVVKAAALPPAGALPDEDLFARLRELTGFYRSVARELASELWGELGERTDTQLVAAGLNRSREPVIEVGARPRHVAGPG